MNEDEQRKLAEETANLRKAVTDLETRIKNLEGIGTPEMQTNRRTRFQENGNWARHYSTVRMTTTTFLVGVSLGILSFRWPATAHPRISFIALSGIVWILAVMLFLVFSRLTYQEMERARQKRNLLPDGIGEESSDPYRLFDDAASWIVALLTLFYGALLFYLGNVRLWKIGFAPDLPYVRSLAYAVPGCLFLVGLGALGVIFFSRPK